MSEPQAPLPPLPEPFAPAPRPLRTPGCGRGALIGCGVLVLLFGVGAVALALNANRMMAWVFHRLEAQVTEKMPADMTPAERARFSAAFADLYRAIDEGKIEPAAVQPLQRELFAISTEVDRGLSREQVLRLTEAAEHAAGRAAPAPAAVPSPS
ncbi:MAG TPA: hypothetical protein VGS57_16100 [Thermoanaerobaculia bacterium]|jgi:hypothetical protein|nr:hypothetical protein [Thermoanaerobaculia bacterium]